MSHSPHSENINRTNSLRGLSLRSIRARPEDQRGEAESINPQLNSLAP